MCRFGLLHILRGQKRLTLFGCGHAALWRARDAERGGIRNLTISLFDTSQRSPLLLLCLANEVPPELFRDDIQVVLPICRIAEGDDFAPHDSGEVEEPAAEPTIHLFWRPGPPPPESPARRLVDSLARDGLLLEPFDRIPAGLLEALAETPTE